MDARSLWQSLDLFEFGRFNVNESGQAALNDFGFIIDVRPLYSTRLTVNVGLTDKKRGVRDFWIGREFFTG